MSGPIKTFKVFISYAHKDERLLKNFENHLSPLKQLGFIESYHHRNISAGSEWTKEIDTHLNTADIIILLISPDFIASDFCYSVEMQQAMKRHEDKKARVIPVILRPVTAWKGTPFGKLEPLPSKGKAVTSFRQLDQGFKEVADGILSVITESISSIKKHYEPFYNLPSQNHVFTGREDVLKSLHDAFFGEESVDWPRLVALTGLGGIGKTQTSVEYAHRYLVRRYVYVLFVKADSYETLASDFAHIADFLDLPQKDTKDQHVAVNAVRDWLETQSDYLLILDNVENWEMIKTFLPSKGRGHILLTTQAQAAKAIPHASEVEIKTMTLEEGVKFLLERQGKNGMQDPPQTLAADPGIAEAIVEKLDGLPLALDQAAAFIIGMGCSLGEYLEKYSSMRDAIHLTIRGKALDHPASVEATFSLSFQKVKQANPGAAELLHLCAFLHPDAIPQEIIEQAASELGLTLQAASDGSSALDRAIDELSKYSLLRCDDNTKTFSTHRLVQEVLKSRMSNDDTHALAARTIRVVNGVFPDVKAETWSLCHRYLAHAHNCAVLIKQWKIGSPEAVRLLSQTGTYLRERVQYKEAEPFYQNALEICRQTLKPENPEVAACYENLALLYDNQGKYTLAELYYQCVLAIRKQALGENSPEVAEIMTYLGLVYYNQGEYQQAEDAYKQALAIDQGSVELENPYIATIHNYLAWLYHNLGRYTEAEDLYERALATGKKTLKHSDVALIINAQALLYRAKGQYIQAETLFNEVRTILEKTFGEDHLNVAMTINDLAWLYRSHGKYKLAEQLYDKSLNIRKKKLGEAHPHTATTLNDIAVLKVELGQYGEAEDLYLQVLKGREEALGPEHPRVATTLYNMGWLYYEQGKYTQAEMHHERALKIRQSTLGEEHSHVGRSLNGLGEVYRVQGKYKDAEKCHDQALSISECTLGAEHPHIVTHLNNLASLYIDTERYSEAEYLYRRALQIREKAREQALDAEPPRLAQILSNLASLYVSQAKYAEAEDLYKKAQEIYQKALEEIVGEKHPLMAQILNGRAMLYTKQTKYAQAEKLFQRALEIREQVLGPKHLDVAQSRNDLAILYLDRGKYDQSAPLLERALEIREQVLGSAHLLVAQTLNNLARLHEAWGEPFLAEAFKQRTWKIRKILE